MQKENTIIHAAYKGLCPVCGGMITTQELAAGKCSVRKEKLVKALQVRGFKEFERYFKERTGKKLKAIQRYWAKKLKAGMSFAAVAPTGIGKTLFGISYAAYLAEKKKKKVYIIVPTTLLLKQSYEKLVEMVDGKVNIMAYLSGMKKAEKEEFMEKLKAGDFDVLLTSSAFLPKHFEDMKHLRFDFIFVDDVDAILKASRNVERLLHLLGFSEEEIRRGEPSPSKQYGQIMVSTATAKPGKKAMLFARLLGFSVGVSRQTMRNVEDYGVVAAGGEEKLQLMLRAARILGRGGLIFTKTEEDAKKVAEFLEKSGVKCSYVTAEVSKKEAEERLKAFLDGELQLLVGVASPYGLLVRGLDYPYHVRYALFYSAPHFKIGLKDVEEASPRMILMLAAIFRNNEQLGQLIPYILADESKREEARAILKDIFERKDFSACSDDVVVKEDHIIIPDVATYIQASGRTSRLFAGGITKGLSIIFDGEEMLRAFTTRASYYDVELRVVENLESLEFERIKKELDESRERYKRYAEGVDFDVIRPAVFVVESPTKAKQIARFFGKPATIIRNNHPFYEVTTGNFVLIITASLGHVVDLVEDEYYHGVIVKDGTFIPVYGSIKKCRQDMVQWVSGQKCPRCGREADDDSRARIMNIAEMAEMAGMIIVATDPDTEGEKIAWDVANFGGIGAEVKRAEFHEVTRNAVLKALEELRAIDENRVKAQIVRRVEDRWIGFELSSILQKHFKDRNLSAGRAQTPVLSWIVERYHEHRKKVRYFLLKLKDGWLPLGTEEEVKLKLEGKSMPCTVVIEEITRAKEEKTPLPPYSTDAVLKDINRFLKIGAREAMQILQQLFENGLITYHRTDSTRVSDKGLQVAKLYLKDDFAGRTWDVSKEGEGAHECIRPTRPFDARTIRDLIYQGVIQTSEPITKKHLRVYDLIFRRFMASQCARYQVEKVKYRVRVEELGLEKGVERVVSASGRAYELYPYAVQLEREMEVGVQKALLTFVWKNKAELYTQADVISLMKERRIGRPSTYSTLLNKLFIRHYIFEKNFRLIPTKRGMIVERFLRENYGDFVSEERTRIVESVMDEIEMGRKDYMDALREFYEEIRRVVGVHSR